MKKIFYLFIVIILLSFGCSKSNSNSFPSSEITISEDEFNNVSSDGNTLNSSIASALSWNATSNASWCTINPTSGNEGTTTPITITVAANTTSVSRKAEITINSSNDSENISITQNADTGIELDNNEFTDISSSGAVITTNINSKYSWGAVVAAVDNWCTVSPTSGSIGTTKVTITVNANTSTSDRETIIYFVANGSTQAEQIKIEQEGTN